MYSDLQKVIVPFLFVLTLSLLQIQFTDAEEHQIPNWIKNKIKLWTVGSVSDEGFLNSLIDLKERGLIRVAKITAVQESYTLPEYGKTIFVKITGRTGDYKQTSPVSLIVVDPKGLRSEYTVSVMQSGAYSTSIPLSFSSTPGTYKVIAYHHGKELPESFFHVKRETHVSSWIKNSAIWWINGKISESDFIYGVQYLIDKDVITFEYVDVDQTVPDLSVSVDGLKAVRRETMQDINVYVSNLAGDIEGATVFVRVEDYGENVLEEFEGVTGSDGKYNVSWELSKDFNDIETFLVFVDVTDGIYSETKLFSFQVYCLCGEPNCKCRN
jgi:hypothetical protein